MTWAHCVAYKQGSGRDSLLFGWMAWHDLTVRLARKLWASCNVPKNRLQVKSVHESTTTTWNVLSLTHHKAIQSNKACRFSSQVGRFDAVIDGWELFRQKYTCWLRFSNDQKGTQEDLRAWPAWAKIGWHRICASDVNSRDTLCTFWLPPIVKVVVSKVESCIFVVRWQRELEGFFRLETTD